MIWRLVNNQCLWYFNISLISIKIDKERWWILILVHRLYVLYKQDFKIHKRSIISMTILKTLCGLWNYEASVSSRFVHFTVITFATMNTNTEAIFEIKWYQLQIQERFDTIYAEHTVHISFERWKGRVKWNCSPKSPLPWSHLFLLFLTSIFECVYAGCSKFLTFY